MRADGRGEQHDGDVARGEILTDERGPLTSNDQALDARDGLADELDVATPDPRRPRARGEQLVGTYASAGTERVRAIGDRGHEAHRRTSQVVRRRRAPVAAVALDGWRQNGV